jgi:hypothetical protein
MVWVRKEISKLPFSGANCNNNFAPYACGMMPLKITAGNSLKLKELLQAFDI